MPLLDSSDYDAIRLRMGFPEGAARFLPPTKIEALKATETATEWVAARTSDTGEHAVRAATAYAAYYLLPKCRGELYAAYNAIDGAPPAASERANLEALLAEAEREIGAITEVAAPEVSRPQGTTTSGISVSF